MQRNQVAVDGCLGLQGTRAGMMQSAGSTGGVVCSSWLLLNPVLVGVLSCLTPLHEAAKQASKQAVVSRWSTSTDVTFQCAPLLIVQGFGI